MSGRTPVSHEDIADRLDRGDTKFAAIEVALGQIREEQQAIRSEQQRAADEQARAADEQKKIREIVEAWVAVKGAGNFIIWWGKVVAGATVILATLLAMAKFKLWTVLGGN